MNRHQFGAHPQAYPIRGDQNREIGLRAVAAAILYQGDASNVERTLSRDQFTATAPAAQSSDREP
jgi:hypothetical protein